MGFGSMIGFNIDGLPNKLVYYVVDNFDPEDMVIKTNKGHIKCDRPAVIDVFGVPNGGTDIDDLEYKGGCEFVGQWVDQFPDRTSIRPTAIADMILSA